MKIVIIGCGKQAEKHIEGFRAPEDVELAVVDLDVERAAQLASRTGVEYYKNINDVFVDESVAAIDIATPTDSHKPLALRAAESGKHFFCEKPLASSLEDAKLIESAARTHNLIGMVGYIYRFAPAFIKAKELCERQEGNQDSTEFGRLCLALFRIGGRGSHQPWKHSLSEGGGAINEMLVHMIDLANWLLGPISKAEMIEKRLVRPKREIQNQVLTVDAEDFVLVKLTNDKGLEIFIEADLITPMFNQYIEIQGDNGSFMGSIRPDFPTQLFCTQETKDHPQGVTNLSLSPVNLYHEQMKHFVDAVRNKMQPTLGTLEDSIAVMEIMESLRASS